MKTNYWRYVFPEDRHKLRKYFYRDVSEKTTANGCMGFTLCLQVIKA